MNNVTEPIKGPNKMKLAAQVARRVQIKSVDLVELNCRNNVSDISEVKLAVAIETNTSSVYDAGEGILAVNANCVMSAGLRVAEPAIRIAATFALVYQLPMSDEYTQDHYDAFGEINGLFNLWPYWRELVQNVTMRMGLPPLTLPVMRVHQAKQERAEGAEQESK